MSGASATDGRIDTSGTTVFRGSLKEAVRLVVLGIVMTAVSAALFVIPYADAFSRYLARGIGVLGTAFFGLATLILIKRLLDVRRAAVTLSPAGLHDQRVAREVIPWTAVQQLSTWTYQGQQVMVVAIAPEVEQSLTLTAMARLSRGANRALGADGLCVTAQGLQVDYDTLFATAVAYAEAAQRPH